MHKNTCTDSACVFVHMQVQCFSFFFLFLLIWTHFSKLVIFKTERNIKIKKFQVQSVVYFYRYTFGVMHCFWDQWLRVNLQLPLSLLKLFTAGLARKFVVFVHSSKRFSGAHSCT